MWKICGEELAPGEKKQIFLEPGVPGYKIRQPLSAGKSREKPCW